MLRKKIVEFFTGITIHKEYPCVNHNDYAGEVSVVLNNGSKEEDITNDHLFLGYKPLVVGIYAEALNKNDNFTISFIHRSGALLARVKLKWHTAIAPGGSQLVLFTGVHATTYLLPPFNRFINDLRRKGRQKSNGNIDMVGNEYKQVQAMYSIPRKVSVISLGSKGLYNMFPTDLHGNAGNLFYVDSLRKAGKACSQVLKYKRIIKADVSLSAKEKVFAMGKNHMQELKPVETFGADGTSVLFGLPLPQQTVSYKELELYHHAEIGIHRILVFRIMNEMIISRDEPVLSCTNGHYLQWRHDHSLQCSYT